MNSPAHRDRLVVVSNRLPVILEQDKDGSWHIKPGSGGLVTALGSVLRNRGGAWIGWPGTSAISEHIDDVLDNESQDAGYTLIPVKLSPDQVKNFYQGYSNEIIWPLFHDLQSLCNFDPTYWRTYCDVNQHYAQSVVEHHRKEDFIWVHDYHLMHVAAHLRHMGVDSRLAFFLHIPFPPLDIFVKLPWRFHLLRALLAYDLIGFQTLRDKRNFIQCVRTLMDDIHIQGKGQALTLSVGDRTLRLGSFPISIDYQGFNKRASTKEVGDQAAQLRRQMPNSQLLLGVDRLDYTKGIPDRLRAFHNALIRYPELQERVTLIQVVVPSREDIVQYHDLKTRIERLVGEINGQFTRPGGWVPIHYVFRSLRIVDLLAYYRAAGIALVTPLKDGMNLVAKEYCACSGTGDGVLILSEFAGAAAQLQKGALLVNPYDIEGVADTIHKAFHMGTNERKRRMRQMRRNIREQDIFWWADNFLRAAFSKNLDAFPQPADYVPRVDFIEAVF